MTHTERDALSSTGRGNGDIVLKMGEHRDFTATTRRVHYNRLNGLDPALQLAISLLI